jgi:hypothetical protein
MPGDISRRTFIQDRHYAGVQAQQGRVLSDADLNEQLEIGQHREETEAIDVIGPCGVPKALDSFRIGKTPDGMDLTISPGRMYVEGLLCELDAEALPLSFPQGVTAFEAAIRQLFANSRRLEAGLWVEISASGKVPKVTRIIDIDTTAKILTFGDNIANFQTSADAAMRVVETYTTQADYPEPDFVAPSFSPPGFLSVDLADGTYVAYVAAFLRDVNFIDDPHVRETALGGPDTSTRLQTVRQVRLLKVTPPAGSITCKTAFPEWNDLAARVTGKVNARTQPPSGTTTPCVLPPTAGFRSLENQLYRVEIQRAGTVPAGVQPLPTFKWSRENASVETGITVNGNTIVANDLGKDSVLGFAGGQWVEIVDDESALKLEPHRLVQIDQIRPATREITTIQTIFEFSGRSRLKLRRWDQTGVSATQDGVAAQPGVWIDLEDGVQVIFSAGTYRSGDFWLIPARTGTGTLDVPPFEIPNSNPIPQHPAGVRRHYCRLALITVAGGAITDIQDCRDLFPPLTDIAASDVTIDGSHCDVLGPARNVQEALDLLCESSRGGCTFIATPSQSVQAVFDAIKPGQDAQVCFPVGTYNLDTSVNITGKGNLKISGSGIGARIIASKLEAALIFKNCASVTIRDLYVETGVSARTQAVTNLLGAALKLLGSITVVDCPIVELRCLTVKCAPGIEPEAACITVNSSTLPTASQSLVNPSVRIAGCSLNVGFMQIGILITGAARIAVEDNDIAVTPKPVSFSFDNLLKDRIFRVGLKSRLVANAVMGTTPPPGGITNAQVQFAGHTIIFKTPPLLKQEWGTLLLKNPPAQNATPVQVLRQLEQTAFRALTDPALQAASLKFQQWLAQLRATDISIASQGIVVGGRMAADVRILNNTVQGVLQGIHVGLSHRGVITSSTDFDTAGTVIIEGNSIEIALRQDVNNRQRHAIFVGNVVSLSILNNRARLISPIGTETITTEGLIVAGFLGRKVLVRHNHLTGFSVAMRFAPHPAFPLAAKVAWLATDNLFESIQTDFTFPPKPNNNPPLTHTGNILFATP